MLLAEIFPCTNAWEAEERVGKKQANAGKAERPCTGRKGRAKAGELLQLGAQPLGSRTCSPAVPGAQARLGPSFIMEMPFLRSQEGDPFHHLAIFGHHRLLKSQGSTRIQSPSGFFWSFRKQMCQVG